MVRLIPLVSAATVCQKNEGFSYLSSVNKDLTLSPGRHTGAYGEKKARHKTTQGNAKAHVSSMLDGLY